MLQILLPIQLPTSWDAVFIEFSLAQFLWLSYQPTRASSFLKYSANLKEESRFWENIWCFSQTCQHTAQIVDHWGLWNLNLVKLEVFCENKKLKTRSHQHTFAFPCCCEMKDCFQFWHDVNILWREVGDIEIAFHKLFFHSAQGLSIPKWCFLGNIFSRKTWRMSEMGDPWDVTFISYHFVAIELLVQYHQQGIIVVKHQRFKSLWSPSSTPVV